MKKFLVAVVVAALGWSVAGAQTPDQQIDREFQAVMKLAAAPKDADDAHRKAAGEAFRTALDKFLADWTPRTGELTLGRFALARGLSLHGQAADAIPHLEFFATTFPRSEEIEEVLLMLGSSYLDTRRFDAARAVYEKFLAERPQSDHRAGARFYLAVCRVESGDVAKGIAELEDLVKTPGDTPILADANIKLIQTLIEVGRVVDARARLDVLLKAHPSADALIALKEQADAVGKPAPEIAGARTWINGEPLTLASRRGRVVVLTFFADMYESSRTELDSMRDVVAKFAGQPVDFVGVTTYYRGKTRGPDKEDELLRQFLSDHQNPFRVAVIADQSLLRAYNVHGVPHTVVVGPDGAVAYIKTGSSRADQRATAALLDAIKRTIPAAK